MAEPFIHLAGVQKAYHTRGADFLAISEASFDVEAIRGESDVLIKVRDYGQWRPARGKNRVPIVRISTMVRGDPRPPVTD